MGCPRSLSKGSGHGKLCLLKMGINLESICMESQGHIFTFDLFFLSQCAKLKGPVLCSLTQSPESNLKGSQAWPLPLTGLKGHICSCPAKDVKDIYICSSIVMSWWHHCDVIWSVLPTPAW